MTMQVELLCFEYPGTRALDDVSCSIAENSITALVGPNGAGKSTLMRCMAALSTPLSGHIYLGEKDITLDAREAHRHIGYLSDFFGLYEELTVKQCIAFHAAAHGAATTAIEQMTNQAAERLGLADRMQQKASELSRGLRQRLAIAQAIVHEPKLLLLDEPASGLDPEARHALATLFRELRSQGMTLVVSSHILAELDEYSTHMLMMKGGKIVSQDVIGEVDENTCDIRLVLSENHMNLHQMLSAIAGVTILEGDEHQLLFRFSSSLSKQHDLLKHFISQGLPVAAFGQEKRDMHETYLTKIQAVKA